MKNRQLFDPLGFSGAEKSSFFAGKIGRAATFSGDLGLRIWAFFNSMPALVKFPRTRLGRLIRDINRKISSDPALAERFAILLALAVN